jgi:hypothetical protein
MEGDGDFESLTRIRFTMCCNCGSGSSVNSISLDRFAYRCAACWSDDAMVLYVVMMVGLDVWKNEY